MIFVDAFVIFICLCTQQVSAFTGNFDKHFRTSLPVVPGADIEQDVGDTKPQVVGNAVVYRGQVNEIDYCIAPADVSLSRAYGQSNRNQRDSSPTDLSMTRYLNNASNRAVRRILLARCWPSEEALNRSLRLAAAAEKEAERAREASGSTAKCPVPRPLLNIIMRKESGSSSVQKGRTSAQYVADQITAFRDKYGSLPGYDYAEAYLETILNLATNGNEPPSVKDVIDSGIYDDAYKRIRAVLSSVGTVFEEIPGTDRLRIASKLNDQDICLSMLDKIQMKNSGMKEVVHKPNDLEEVETVNETESDDSKSEDETTMTTTTAAKQKKKRRLPRLRFWKKVNDAQLTENENEAPKSIPVEDKKKQDAPAEVILLSAEEPTMTRQLNAVANIVLRALQFGGDQELLVLSETLFSNRKEFVRRWYPDTGEPEEDMEKESRPGVQFLNALVLLLREAYDNGVVTSLDPSTNLIQSYSNAYERLMATLVELGSGYIRPEVSNLMAMPKPRTAQEELGRFAVWESNFRSSGGETATYPEDLVGSWEVADVVGGEMIGVSTVVFEPQGEVSVAPPLQGLRWRLDPGPTHLDTCTFQVLSEDGTVLQYRGFIDRGARVESRFSGRSTKIRGSVMFQMRDGGAAGMADGYWKDMLPINYKTGTTKFVMTKQTGAAAAAED